MAQWESKRVLITGKAYPNPSESYIETVCTGGITAEGELIRLFPIPYRYLDPQQQYKKWSWIDVEAQKADRDPRKESFRVRDDSIAVVGDAKDRDIKELVLPNVSTNHDTLTDYYDHEYGSLGFIRVEPVELHWEESSEEWNAKKQRVLSQLRLFDDQPKELENIPWAFKLKFLCWEPCSSCEKREHDKLFLTWDVYQAFRRFRDEYGGEDEGLRRVYEKFWEIFTGDKHNFLLLGTHSVHHSSWMIGGYYCPTSAEVESFYAQQSLF